MIIDNAGNTIKAPSQKTSVQQLLRLQVSNGTTTDEAIIYFNQNAKNSFDVYDSPKLTNASNTIPEIYSLAGNEELAINGLNALTPTTEIPLGFRTGESNNFVIKVNEFVNFDPNTRIILRDNLTNTNSDITLGDGYRFSSSAVTTANRFSVIFSNYSTTNINRIEDKSINIFKNINNNIVVEINENIDKEAIVKVFNTGGQLLYRKTTIQKTININNVLVKGVYLVSVNISGLTKSQKVVIN